MNNIKILILLILGIAITIQFTSCKKEAPAPGTDTEPLGMGGPDEIDDLGSLVMSLQGGGYTEADILVKQNFRDDNTYIIVCKGFPMKGTSGIVKDSSAKRAARLNAYYFAKKIFDNSVDPGKYGDIEKTEKMDDHIVIHYVLEMKGLKNKRRI
ncbi:MAG: hypothetical protein GY754_30360 [bacterium]|nr:hypothetical protein [bacterium]